MNIMVVCGHGLGTSLMLEMSIKSILKELNVDANVDHLDLGSVKGTEANCDIYIGTNDITDQLKTLSLDTPIVSLDNIIDKKAINERLSVVLQELGAL